MVFIIPEQENRIKKFIEIFKEYSKTKEFQEDMIDRKERVLFFSRLRSENIQNMDELLFGEIISKLWASAIWTNKDYLIKKLIVENGMDNLKIELWNLLFASMDIGERYDNFNNIIKGLGPSSITEILSVTSPKNYGIWNSKAREALKILGFEKELPLDKYKINGQEYKKFNEILKQISFKLDANGFKDSDLFFVDYFLYNIWENGELKEEKREIIKQRGFAFDHDEIKEHVKEIGEALGFEAETEKKISYGSRVDVIWRAKIANLGVVIYVFEVHKNGSIDSLLINLQKARRNLSVQKVIAVSDREQIEKIEKEARGLGEDFRKSLSLWDVADVSEVHDKLGHVKKTIAKLGLVKSEFEIEDNLTNQ